WLASIAAETLTAQLAVYNHFASSNEKCRSGLTERHYRHAGLFFCGGAAAAQSATSVTSTSLCWLT
ncbi:hypothetical protein ACQUK4_21930, partial [Ralstonia pseudosolanacearum]